MVLNRHQFPKISIRFRTLFFIVSKLFNLPKLQLTIKFNENSFFVHSYIFTSFIFDSFYMKNLSKVSNSIWYQKFISQETFRLLDDEDKSNFEIPKTFFIYSKTDKIFLSTQDEVIKCSWCVGEIKRNCDKR